MSLVVFFYLNNLQVGLGPRLEPHLDLQLAPLLDLPPAGGSDQTAAAVPGPELAGVHFLGCSWHTSASCL